MALAIHVGHDSNIAMSIDGRVQCVLELERFFGERYYDLLGHLANKVSRYLIFVRFLCILIILALGYPHFLKPSVMLGLPIARSDSCREFPMLF